LIGLRTRGDAGLLRAAGTALHSIEFGVLSAVLFPIALHYALAATERKVRVRRLLVVVLCSAGVPFSLSRSGVLAITIGIFVLFRVWSRFTQRVALLALPLTVVFLRLAIPGLVGTFVSFFVNAGNDNSIEGRTNDYELVGQLFAARPWFGLGAGTFRREEYTVLDNYFLTTLVSMGIVGVIAFTLVLTVPYAMAIRISRRAPSASDRHLATAMAASLAGAMVATFTFDLLEFPSISGVVFLLIGLIGALHRTCGRAPGSPGPDSHTRYVKDRLAMRPALFRRSVPVPEDMRRDASRSGAAQRDAAAAEWVANMSNARRRDAGSVTTLQEQMD
jgi:O-antigen ligase